VRFWSFVIDNWGLTLPSLERVSSESKAFDEHTMSQLKIGYFSLLSQVPVKTLRYYDELGLLKPAEVDKFTGYRYYRFDQLAQLNRILALKDLGLSLEQIAQLLKENLSSEQLTAMLHLRHAQLQSELDDLHEQIKRVEARLKQHTEGSMSNYDVILKTVKPMLVASKRIIVPTNDQVPEYLGPVYGAICEHMAVHDAKQTGACLTVWYTPTSQLTNEDVEVAYPIESAIPSSAAVQVRELPEVRVASAVHHGDFENFSDAHAAILRWAEANGYRAGSQYREIYLKHDPNDMRNTTTEVQIVVEKA
jgi:DNA-binding transcriptional MerR regulator